MYCIFALVFVAASFATADPAPIQGEVDAVDIAPAELKSLQERRRLVRGSYQLHVKNYKGNTTEVAAEVEFHFWFDFSGVELMRQDEIHYSTSVTKAGSDGGQQPLELIGSDGRSVTRQVRRENELVHWSPDRFSDGSSVAATMSEIRFVNSGQLQSWIDPRVVGMTVNSFGHQYSQHLQSIIGYPGRTHLQATTFEFEGRQLDRIDYEISEDNVKGLESRFHGKVLSGEEWLWELCFYRSAGRCRCRGQRYDLVSDPHSVAKL